MTRVLIAFGSNLGDRRDTIYRAVHALGGFIEGIKTSSVYETAPMYVTDQPAFLNGVLRGITPLGPLALVRRLKEVEHQVGRLPRTLNGPREIDLDLLVYGRTSLVSNAVPHVQVPHPRMTERRFVLEPLLELEPDSLWATYLPGVMDQSVVRWQG